MGATGSTAIPMSEIDVDSYDGPRFADVVPGTRESGRGPIYVTKRVALEPAEQTLYHNFQRGLALDHGQRPCYGTRVVVDGKPGSYEWITYNQVQARVEAIAAGLTQFAGLKRGSFVGIFSKNRVEWCLASHACDRQTYPLVPLYDTLGPEAIPFIVNQTELTTLLCAKEQFDAVLKCKDTCPTLHYVVQYETVTPEQHRLAEEKGFQLKSLGEIQDIGRSNPIRPDAPRPEDIATICYTSGTTGNPKGVILLHKNMTAFAALVEDRVGIYQGSVHMSYLPLAHVFERTLINVLTRVGACSGFYCGDVLTLLDDVAALKPTIFISVPRLFNRIYDKITQGVNAAGGLRKLLFDQAYAAKKAGIPTGHKTHALWDKLVFAKVRMVLGGRVTQVVSASAPLSGEVKEFLRIVFSCDVLEGYGLSETAAGLTLSSGSMPVGPHVGPPIGNMEVRLVDVPEMGYTSNDKPRPRGEVVCRGETVFAGYFKEPEKTAEVFDKDGWFHTGDIGCWNADGTLSIIDRKKNIFKLSQGEYVAAEKIEGIYQKSKYVAQIFVYGDSFQSVLVAVAVPDPEIAEAWGASKGRSKAESTVAALAKDPEFQKEVLADMNRVGKAAELRGFEFVKKIHLEAEPFSVDAGLITPTFKLKRPQLKAHYQAKIDEMYASLSTLGRP